MGLISSLRTSALSSFAAAARYAAALWNCGRLPTLLIVVLTILLGLFPAALYWVTAHLVNAIVEAIGRSDWMALVGRWLVALVALQALRLAADQLRQPMQVEVQENMEQWIQANIARAAATIELPELQTAAIQDELARARETSGIDMLNALGHLLEVGEGSVAAISLSLILIHYGILLPLMPLLGGLVGYLSAKRYFADAYRRKIKQTSEFREQSGLAEILTDRQTGKELRLFDAAGPWLERWEELGLSQIRLAMAPERGKLRARLLMDLAHALIYGAALAILVTGAFHGSLSIGGFVAAIAAVASLDAIWQHVSHQVTGLAEHLSLFQGDLFGFLDRRGRPGAASVPDEGRIQLRSTSSHLPEKNPGSYPPPEHPRQWNSVELDEISFTYPGASDPALWPLSLQLAAGEKVAIVGPNGAGKTTLARILLGLYLPTAGAVRLGGAPMAADDREAWWDQCSGVFQDFTQYQATARDNIGFGDLSRPERVARAAADAGAAEVVDALPDRYETVLGPTFGGVDLSGGQWQRLAIARSFMRESPALVMLDEPTAALDPLAEQAVYDRFADLTTGRVAVLISHRLSSVRHCDRILVFDHGRLIEDGTHLELLARGGLYAQLFEAQARHYR